VRLSRIWLTDFRSYSSVQVELSPTFTAVLGRNGAGKTNLLEAVSWLASLSSFRGAASSAMVREGAEFAVVRAEVERDGRELLLEAQLAAAGRNRVMLNRQPLRQARDLLGALRVTVFTPDDLVVVKGGPAERRRFVDEALVARRPKLAALRSELDRVLRQRNSLLKQAGYRLDEAAALTLDVWDDRLATAGEALTSERLSLLAELEPRLNATYGALAGSEATLSLVYESSWRSVGLAEALQNGRQDDLRRGISTVGPHRDDVGVQLNGLPARTHASQGEQRTLALALRLSVHDLVAAAAGSSPVLLLDDVFSELDPVRSAALLENLPDGQVLLTTAGGLPDGAVPDAVLQIRDGTIVARG
jgi:DNA replication and repair protein RecF